VPGSFRNGNQSDAVAAQDAREFFAWAQSDQRIAGLFPWKWACSGSCVTPKCLSATNFTCATRIMPLARAAYEEIGRAILGRKKKGPRKETERPE